MITSSLVRRLLARTQRYGRALALQGTVLNTIFRRAPVEVVEPLGPTLLLGQAVAKALETAVALWMREAEYPTLPLVDQEALGVHALHWGDLRTALENMALQQRMPAIAALEQTTASAAAFGAVARGVALGTRLEQVIFTADHVITLDKFWAVQAPALTSIGRLISADPVLSATVPFNTVTEALHVLDGCTPLVPAVDAMLDAIEAARPPAVRGIVPPQVRAWTVRDGDSLEQIAVTLLGNADYWRYIAAYNNLRYPYLSNDPLIQYGDLLGEKPLAQPTVIGSGVLALTNVAGLAVHQRVYVRGVSGAQIVSIESIDDVTKTCHVTPVFTHVFPAGVIGQVFPPAYEITSRVLQSGDTLLVPLPAEGAQTSPILVNVTGTGEDRVYGIDLAVSEQGRLHATAEGDLTRVSGRSNFVQALRHRVTTPRGSLLHHPDYGFGIVNFIGERHVPFLEFLATVEAHQAVLRDPRVLKVEDARATARGDTMEVSFTAVTTIEDRFPLTAPTPLRATT